MGVGTIIIGIAILLVVVAYFGTALAEFFEDIKESAQERRDAKTQEIPKFEGDTLCDLKIIVYGQVVEDGFPPTIKVRFGEGTLKPEIIERTWLNCDTPTTFALLNIFELPPPAPLAIFIIDEKFHIEGVLRDNQGHKIDATTEKSLYKYIELKAGITPTPLNFEKTFIIYNIAKRDYSFDIYVGRQIIGQEIGEPITIQIRG